MESIQRRLVSLLVSLALGLAALPAAAADEAIDNARPTASAMFGDAILARPALLALTAVGTVAFVASLPFSVLGGNVGEAGRMLVVGPAKSTFLRCLGCTEAQDRWKRSAVAQETSEEAPQ